MSNKRCSYQHIPRVLGALCQEPGAKAKYIFLIIPLIACHYIRTVSHNANSYVK